VAMCGRAAALASLGLRLELEECGDSLFL